MSLSILLSLFALRFTFANAEAFTGTYYVATGGDDLTGDGSSGGPWATITNALGACIGSVRGGVGDHP